MLVALVAAAFPGCKEATLDLTGGSSGQSFTVRDQFVVLNNGFLRGDVTWVAVRNWPVTSTSEQRRTDTRVTVGPHGCCLIRRQGGESSPPDPEARVYFFDGEVLTTFPIRMKEDDFIGFPTNSLKSYADVLDFLRRFEVKQSSSRAAEQAHEADERAG